MTADRTDQIVDIRDLRFSYPGSRGVTGRSKFLQIDSLSIGRGGCHIILGPNGCGKTTLLKLIAGLLSPDSGSIDCGSRAVLVHQHPYLLSTSVFGNVAYGLKIRKLPKAEISVRVDSELDRWGLSGLSDRHSSKLSGGERQRTAIARAMVLQPEILLLDEPTASVDPENISQMEALIDRVTEAGTTVIMSTHHMDFAYRMADSIFRLSRGRPAAVYENILSGRVRGRKETLNIFEADGTELFCPGRDGDFRRAVFSENDVILSRECIRTSARNVLESVVVSIERSGEDFAVMLDCGFRYNVRISESAAAELDISPGDRLFALIKSSSIALY